MESNKNHKGPAIKATVLIVFLLTAIVIIGFTPLREYLTAERLGLLSWKVFFSLGLFVFSFFIPKIIERLRASQKAGIA